VPHVEAVAEFLYPGCDLIEFHRFPASVALNYKHIFDKGCLLKKELKKSVRFVSILMRPGTAPGTPKIPAFSEIQST
jgi:hypothetical protein